MAKVMNPLISSEARGRVQGTVYNTWRGTRYAKTQTAPAQPRTTAQLKIRAWLLNLVRRWQTLESGERGTWNDYASAHPDIDWTNSPKRITGLNWYTRCNIRLAMLLIAAVDTAPETPAPDTPTDFVLVGGAGQFTFTWTAYAGTATSVDIWLLGPHSAGVLAKRERSKHFAFKEGEAVGPHTIDGLQAGVYTCWLRAVDETNGLASGWARATVVVT